MPAPAAPAASVRFFAALGALLFAASLVYFLYAYMVAWSAPAVTGSATASVAWNLALFTAFALHHSVFARSGIRDRMARRLPPPLERSVYVWVASLAFVAVCAWWQPVPGVAWRAEGGWVWTLRGVQALGVWLTLRSAAILDLAELAGLRRPDPLRQADSGRSGRTYRTTGPYGWIRHPIYSGWFLIVLAATPMTMTRLTFASVSCAYLLLAIPLEERTLRAAGDGAYERYMRQVRWRLVPGMY